MRKQRYNRGKGKRDTTSNNRTKNITSKPNPTSNNITKDVTSKLNSISNYPS